MNTVERIKFICKERKIPISALEKACGFSNGYISQLRKGVVPDDRLRIIADYFGVSVDYLMTGEDTRIPAPAFEEDHIKLIAMYSKLNKEQKEAVFNLLRSFNS